MYTNVCIQFIGALGSRRGGWCFTLYKFLAQETNEVPKFFNVVSFFCRQTTVALPPAHLIVGCYYLRAPCTKCQKDLCLGHDFNSFSASYFLLRHLLNLFCTYHQKIIKHPLTITFSPFPPPSPPHIALHRTVVKFQM